ncbi:hypothetical protein [Rhodococcoides yunnanense]|uniref:hypothetical protein n=1 Tax=Rhodococcoides yunnanense TaxID=278209 RepID=UPI0014760B3F|nr:hypothetical protein [Rhodococcus yunnanensis]
MIEYGQIPGGDFLASECEKRRSESVLLVAMRMFWQSVREVQDATCGPRIEFYRQVPLANAQPPMVPGGLPLQMGGYGLRQDLACMSSFALTAVIAQSFSVV